MPLTEPAGVCRPSHPGRTIVHGLFAEHVVTEFLEFVLHRHVVRTVPRADAARLGVT